MQKMLLGMETHPANLPDEARPLLLQHCRLSVVCLCTLVGKESRLELAMPPASARCAALADADTEVLTGGPDAGDLAANRRCRGSEMSRGPRPRATAEPAFKLAMPPALHAAIFCRL